MNDDFRVPVRWLQAGISACLVLIVAIAVGIYTVHREVARVEIKLGAVQNSVEQTKILASGTTTGIIGLLQHVTSFDKTVEQPAPVAK